jgi:hypothetical protein
MAVSNSSHAWYPILARFFIYYILVAISGNVNCIRILTIADYRGGYGASRQSLIDPPLTAKEYTHPESLKHYRLNMAGADIDHH